MEELEKLKVINELANGIVHDINNVLTTIIGHTDILLSTDSCCNCRDEIEIIKNIALDGAEITKRFKNFIKPYEGTKKIFNICDTIKSAVIITKPIWYNQAQFKGKKIRFDYNSSSPIFVYGNESEFREAIVNIIFNSIDAIEVDGKIEIEVLAKDKSAIVNIKDNGIGMTEEVKNKIFTPFFTTKKDKGSGLGLSTVKRSIDEMGGQIEVFSKSNVGTLVKISLPVMEEKENMKREAGTDISELNHESLIIDDQLEICSVVKEMLSKIIKGKIDVSTKAKDALNMISRNSYDIIITDISMPDINGMELIDYIRSIKHNSKIIAMTGWNGILDKNKNKPDYILSKPFTIEELEEAINKIYCKRDNLAV